MGVLTSCFVTITVATLLFSVVGGIYAFGSKRIFLGGFAIGAWGFLVFSYGITDLDSFGSRLLTGDVIDHAKIWLFGDPPTSSTYAPINDDPNANARWQLDFIGNCFFAWVSGLLCGLAACRFARVSSRLRKPLHRDRIRRRFPSFRLLRQESGRNAKNSPV